MKSIYLVLFCVVLLALACQKNAPTPETPLDEDLGVMNDGEDPFDGDDEAAGEDEEDEEPSMEEEEEEGEGGEEEEEEEEEEVDEDEF